MVSRREFLRLAGFGVTGITISAFGSDHSSEAAGNGDSLPFVNLPYRPYTLSPYDKGLIIEDAWPTVFFGDEVTAEVRRKVSELPWARKVVQLMEKEAVSMMGRPPQLPVEPVGWRHDFYSRVTAEHLLFDPTSPNRFLDPSTKTYEADDAQHRAWVLLMHERTYRIMRSLGVLYRVTDKEQYARWVADGMRQAVEYFKHNEFIKAGGSGKALYYQPLYDAAVLLLIANAYSLTRKSSEYSPDDHRRIYEQIFQARIPDQLDFLKKHPVHNMSCYVSAALAYAGHLFEKKDWMEPALGDSSGLRTQLMKGIKADREGKIDGFWYEGTMFYHFYSLCPLVTLWELDRLTGGKHTGDPAVASRFAEMFAAPVELADDKLRLPPVGDLGAPKVMNLAAYRHLYEYAAGKIDKDRYGPILAEIYRVSGAPRYDLTALAYGPDQLPKTKDVQRSHSLLPVSKIGVFRTQEPFDMQVMFRTGDYVGGHDHPDRLGITLNAFGEVISPDLGTAGYSLHGKTHNYYRKTISHNTIFVDEKDQSGSADLEWKPDADPARARGVVSVDGVRLVRTLFFIPPYLVILDEYSSEEEHRYGWIHHAYGIVELDEFGKSKDEIILPALPDDGAFSHLINRKTLNVEGIIKGSWTVSGNAKLGITAVSDGPYELTTCVTPGQPLTDNLGCVLLRVSGKKRRFGVVLEPYKDKPSVDSIHLEGSSVVVTSVDGTTKSLSFG